MDENKFVTVVMTATELLTLRQLLVQLTDNDGASPDYSRRV